MHQFFVEPSQIQGNKIIITGSDVSHIKNVLRMKIGEEISVRTGGDEKEYRCEIASLADTEICCKLRFIKEEGVELPSRVYLFQGLPKGDKMELIVQKAVELGVYEIIPVAAGRSIVRLDEKREKNRIARWQGIAEAAAKQSKRAVIPQIGKIMTMSEAVSYAASIDIKLIPYELAEDMERTKELIDGAHAGSSVAVFIGPEGGFTEEEIALAGKYDIVPVTLGKRILRTETAGLVVLSWLMYHFA